MEVGGVSLLLPQAREGRKEALVSGQRMETIPDQPGRWGSKEGCWSSDDLGLHLLPIYTFTRGGHKDLQGYLCLCCSPDQGQTGRANAPHSTAPCHPLPNTAFKRPSEETLSVTLLTDRKTEAKTRKQGHGSVTRTRGSSPCSKSQPKGSYPRPLGMPAVLVKGGNMFDLPARTCGLRDVAGSAKT